MDRLNAYKVLGLHENATEEDVKNAYRALAQKYSVDSYDAGPLRDQAEQKMNEINDAFDTLMSYLRTGNVEAASPTGNHIPPVGQFASIRQMINDGNIDEALTELTAVQNGSASAEWNFLMGSAYYYKGWLDQALFYFQMAVQLEPGNREYQAALRNLQSSAGGNMQGNPYAGQNNDTQAINCACNTCTFLCCMDACCSMCRGF